MFKQIMDRKLFYKDITVFLLPQDL
jgi:hypothetical protein